MQVNAAGALSYMLMALGHTGYAVHVENQFWIEEGDTPVREFLWLRYANWGVTTPIVIAILGFLAGANSTSIFYVGSVAVFFFASLFAGAIHTGFHSTWAIFSFSCVAYVVLLLELAFPFRRSAYRVHVEIGKLYDFLALITAVILTGNLILWGVSEGGHVTTVDQEVVVYTVLDVLGRSVFGLILCFGREAIVRYGTFLGLINQPLYDIPVAKSAAGYGPVATKEEAAPTVHVTIGGSGKSQ